MPEPQRMQFNRRVDKDVGTKFHATARKFVGVKEVGLVMEAAMDHFNNLSEHEQYKLITARSLARVRLPAQSEVGKSKKAVG